jgi:hypothetical protein
LKGKERATQSSKNDDSSDNEDNELDDEQMAFLIKNFRRVLRKSNFREEDQARLVLVARKLGTSLRIVRKKRRRTRIPRIAHSRGTSQDTKRVPVKLILVKNEVQMKRATPIMKMLQPWHPRPPLCINQVCLKISPMMRIKVQSCA